MRSCGKAQGKENDQTRDALSCKLAPGEILCPHAHVHHHDVVLAERSCVPLVTKKCKAGRDLEHHSGHKVSLADQAQGAGCTVYCFF